MLSASSRDYRPVGAVPRWVAAALGLTLAAQIGVQAVRPAAGTAASDLPPPPGAGALRLASFGEPEAGARLAMLYLQSYDFAGTNAMPYSRLDYQRLVGWLRAILELDPRSQYPLFSAARVYAETEDPARGRIALEFVYEAFLHDPNRRWPWLAHAALLAKHRLHDLPLARRYAQAVQRRTTSAQVPLWAKQMEIFILEDMDELEAARIMLGGLLQSGTVHDPAELRFLQEHLEELERRVAASKR
jgi:hypothetical protein